MNYFFLYKLSEGTIYGSPYLGDSEKWTNIPDGCGVIGPIAQTDVTATDAYRNPAHYLVQNNLLVQVSNIAALQLTAAQNKKKSEISTTVGTKIVAGYQSTVVLASTNKAHFYGTTLEDQANFDAEYAGMLGNPSGTTIPFRPQDELDFVDHTYAEFKTISEAVKSRVKSYLGQGYAYYRQLAATTTVDEVNAIVVNVVDPS